MARRRQVPQWSPVECDFLRKNKTLPLTQLSLRLSKSISAVKNMIKQLAEDKKAGKTVPLLGPTKNRRSRIGKREDCGGLFFRSSYESNCYRYFTRYLANIEKVEFEPDTFMFTEWFNRGTLSYLPDFKLTFKDGRVIYVEAKGYLQPEGKTKLRRFKRYYPEQFEGMLGVTGGPKTLASKFMEELGFADVWSIREMKKEYIAAGLSDWEE